jgi:GMP synthase (glutamine-hydrolysing)
MLSSEVAQRKYEAELEAIRGSEVPVLGVCFGHQLLAIAFGSRVVPDARTVVRFVRTDVVAEDPIFWSLPVGFMLTESRSEIVESLPSGFKLLARSETSPIAAMRHRARPFYGVQSHPERYTSKNPAGRTVVGNFVRLLS